MDCFPRRTRGKNDIPNPVMVSDINATALLHFSIAVKTERKENPNNGNDKNA
jgi:hypothetical protein